MIYWKYGGDLAERNGPGKGNTMKQTYEKEVMNLLRMKGKLELQEVLDRFGISESTARRLFTRMEQEGLVIRVHGGIQLPGKNPAEYSFERLVKSRLKEKEAIAKEACSLLEDGDIVFCDAGTTVMCFCMELLRRMEREPMELRVYTNSLANFEILASRVPVTLIGGDYRDYRKDFAGYLAETALRKVHFTKSFFGADGCDMKNYFTTTDFDTARLDETAMENSSEVVILCTSEKFSSCTQIGYAVFEDVDRVITDGGISTEQRKKLENCGIAVTVAAEKTK